MTIAKQFDNIILALCFSTFFLSADVAARETNGNKPLRAVADEKPARVVYL